MPYADPEAQRRYWRERAQKALPKVDELEEAREASVEGIQRDQPALPIGVP